MKKKDSSEGSISCKSHATYTFNFGEILCDIINNPVKAGDVAMKTFWKTKPRVIHGKYTITGWYQLPCNSYMWWDEEVIMCRRAVIISDEIFDREWSHGHAFEEKSTSVPISMAIADDSFGAWGLWKPTFCENFQSSRIDFISLANRIEGCKSF